jgi:tRNA(His) 5'-end guanylyltransferase
MILHAHKHEEFECSTPVCDNKAVYIVVQDAADYFLNREQEVWTAVLLCVECKIFAHDELGMPAVGTLTCTPMHILPN